MPPRGSRSAAPGCRGSTARTPPWSGFRCARGSLSCPRGGGSPRSSGSVRPRYRVRSCRPLNMRPPVALVIAGAAALAREAPGDAVDQRGFIDLDQDHMVERLTALGEHRIKRLGLRHGARKTVEDEAAGAVRLADPVGDHL